MSKSTDRRNKITATLGALSALAFTGVYGLIAGRAPANDTSISDLSAATGNVLDASAALAAPTAAPQAAAYHDDDDDDDDHDDDDDDHDEYDDHENDDYEDEDDDYYKGTAPAAAPVAGQSNPGPASVDSGSTSVSTHTRTRGS